jgi:hypothetical protein
MKTNLSDQEKMPRRNIVRFHIAAGHCTFVLCDAGLRA